MAVFSQRLAVLIVLALAVFAGRASAQPTLIDINPGTASSSPAQIVTMNGIAYFVATSAAHGSELWRSDGTVAGTYMVADIHPGPNGSFVTYLMTNGDRLYFNAYNGVNGEELWKSDGTAAGTQMVVDMIPGSQGGYPRHITTFGNGLVLSYCTYATGCELFKSDGTASGTVLVKDILPGSQSSFPEGFTVLGNLIVFQGNDGVTGQELWKSNGTTAGTVLVKNIDPTPLVYPPDGFGRSYPTDFVVVGTKAYFSASNGTNGKEVWRTDGTTAGTVMVTDLYPGSGNGLLEVGVGPSFYVFDDKFFFIGRRGQPGDWYRIFVTDGTAAGTVETELYHTQLQRARRDGTYYFSGSGIEPWVGDLTVAGSFMLKDINPGVDPYSSPKDFVAVSSTVYFSASNPALGNELWRSDGTTAGTAVVADLNPGAANANPTIVTRAGDYAFFAATSSTNGTELYAISLNRAPTADAGTDQIIGVPAPVLLDGGGSFDPDGDTLTYEWRDENDTVIGTDAAISVTLPVGIHDLTLTVSDGEYSASDSVRVRVGNRAPVANVTPADYMAFRNEPITFDGRASSDPDGDTLTYSWDFGDGTTGSGPEPSHAYQTAGPFVVHLTVNDGQADSEPAAATAHIENRVPTAVTAGPYQAVRGEAIIFDGTGSADPEGDPLEFVWSFGDDTSGAGISPTHAYSTLGTFTVTLRVHDGAAPSEPVTTSVTITNRAPTANAGGPYTGVRNVPITLSGALSSDPDNDNLTYEWDLGDGTTWDGPSPEHTYTALGTYTVTLTVRDGIDVSAPVTTTVTIANRAPEASTPCCYSAVRNETVVFDASGSSDADGDPLTYHWDFGDGTTGSGVSPSHAFSTVGEHTVSLTVHDGLTSSTAVFTSVAVNNQVPVANAGGPYTAVRNAAVTFDGSGSTDADGDELTYFWDFGGGATGTGSAPSHAFTTMGTFTVSLYVNDGMLPSNIVTTTVTVGNQTPVAHAGGPYTGVRNASITFNGSQSGDADNDALTYEWNFGDGATGTGVSPAHAYAALGAYTVTLTVRDGTEASAPVTATVTIENQSPVANAGGPHTGTRLAAIAFSGAGSSDPDNDALAYAWDFGDGSTGGGVTPSHAYAATGTFTVSLVVNDGTGDSAPHTTTVTITNVAPSAALTDPADGSVLTTPATVLLGADATDPDGGVANVEFFANGVKVGEDATAPYAATWSGAIAGSYALVARVTDSSGASVDSAARSIVLNAPPSVSITSPVSGAQFAAPASITITANAADADGTIAQVEFFRGSTSLGVDATSPYAVTWSGAAAGSYTITAVATDNRGAVTTSTPVTVKVTATLGATADSYVRASNGNSNFGTATTLTVQQGSSNSNNRWSYLKFDLTSVPTITNAKIRVYGAVSSTTGTTIQTAVFPASNTTWTETGLTWNNRPATGGTALSTVTIVNNSTASRWYELDVTAYLQAEKAAGRNVVTLVLKNLANSSPYVSLVSRQGSAANRPQLVVVP